MSAPKRKGSHTKAWRFPRDNAKFNRWLDELEPPQPPTQKTAYLSLREAPDPAQSFRETVLEYVGAKHAFKELTDHGLQGSNEDIFWRHLWGLASLAKAEAKVKRSKRRGVRWYSLPGLPPYKMQRLPGQVRGWADEIERVGKAMQSNAAYGMVAGACLPVFLLAAIPNQAYGVSIGGELFREVGSANPSVPADLARRVLKGQHTEVPKLAELPNLLRFYAEYIEAVSKLTANAASKGPALLKMMPLQFIELVKTVTGKPHWNEIATLLTAAYNANGCPAHVDMKALQMQYSRSRKK